MPNLFEHCRVAFEVDVVVADAELEAPLFSSDFALTYFWKILPFFSAEPTTMRSVSGWNRTRREVICLGL